MCLRHKSLALQKTPSHTLLFVVMVESGALSLAELEALTHIMATPAGLAHPAGGPDLEAAN